MEGTWGSGHKAEISIAWGGGEDVEARLPGGDIDGPLECLPGLPRCRGAHAHTSRP